MLFTKTFIQGGSPSSSVTYLLGTKLKRMFIIVSLKIDTCLCTDFILNKVSQFTDSIDFYIYSLLSFVVPNLPLIWCGIFNIEIKFIMWIWWLYLELKAYVRYFLPNFSFSPDDSLSKTMKNVFYFI